MNQQLKTASKILIATLLVVTSFVSYAKTTPTITPTAAAQPAAAKAGATLLFQQVSPSSTITPIDPKKGTYRLTMTSPTPFITFFSDAPERYTGMMPLSEFYRHWGKNRIFKKQFQPNADLEAYDSITKTHINRTVTLSEPSYQAKTDTVSYKITLLGEQSLPATKLTLGYTALFIDDFHWGGNRFDPGGK